MQITKNCIVTVDYHINDLEGNLLYKEEEPIVYLHGNYGQIFAKIEETLDGKQIGDTFSVTLSAEDAFGAYDPDLVVTEKLSELPDDVSVGMEIDGFEDDEDDETEAVVIYTVTKIEDDHATLDGNHPFADMDIVFEGIILDIEEAPEDEIQEILETED